MERAMADRTADHEIDQDWASIYVSAPDGLRLHVRSYGDRAAEGLPVICLPGLTRSSADFDVLAAALTGDPREPRRVVAIDYRGRGRSEYDSNPGNYVTAVEAADVAAVQIALGLEPAIFIGTSRGGLITMILAAVRPTAIAGAVLNDIGPVIEAKGLMRIKSYVGKLPAPRHHEEGADILRRLFDAQFPKFTADDWLAAARLTWKQVDGGLVPDYDVNLARSLEAMDIERPLEPLWDQFDALARVPLMVIRGANSDVLSTATLEAMRARRLDIDVVEVPNQGHAPRLVEPEIIRRISAFITFCELSARHV
jgi:pimeloyl-ACP methyl ester carboxylesterase